MLKLSCIAALLLILAGCASSPDTDTHSSGAPGQSAWDRQVQMYDKAGA
jgi:hypothetical protein